MYKCALKPPSRSVSSLVSTLYLLALQSGEKLLESPFTVIHVKSPLSLTETEQMLPGVSESPRQTELCVHSAASSKPSGVDPRAKACLAPALVWRETRRSLATTCSQSAWGPGDLKVGALEPTGLGRAVLPPIEPGQMGLSWCPPVPPLAMESTVPLVFGTAIPHSEKPSTNKGTRCICMQSFLQGVLLSLLLCSSW